MNIELEVLLTEGEVAEITKRSLSAIRKDRYAGRGVPTLKIGASVRYLPSDLSAYLEGCRAERPPAAGASAGGR